LPSFFFAIDYQRKSGPDGCVPVRYAALSFASLSLSEHKKRSQILLFAKTFCYYSDIEKERGLKTPKNSQNPHGVHAPPYRKMQLHRPFFGTDI